MSSHSGNAHNISKILELLGSSSCDTWDDRLCWGNSLDGAVVGEKVILFPRIED